MHPFLYIYVPLVTSAGALILGRRLRERNADQESIQTLRLPRSALSVFDEYERYSERELEQYTDAVKGVAAGILEDLKVELDRACDSAIDAAHQRLKAELERAEAEERLPKRNDLVTWMDSHVMRPERGIFHLFRVEQTKALFDRFHELLANQREYPNWLYRQYQRGQTDAGVESRDQLLAAYELGSTGVEEQRRMSALFASGLALTSLQALVAGPLGLTAAALIPATMIADAFWWNRKRPASDYLAELAPTLSDYITKLHCEPDSRDGRTIFEGLENLLGGWVKDEQNRAEGALRARHSQLSDFKNQMETAWARLEIRSRDVRNRRIVKGWIDRMSLDPASPPSGTARQFIKVRRAFTGMIRDSSLAGRIKILLPIATLAASLASQVANPSDTITRAFSVWLVVAALTALWAIYDLRDKRDDHANNILSMLLFLLAAAGTLPVLAHILKKVA